VNPGCGVQHRISRNLFWREDNALNTTSAICVLLVCLALYGCGKSTEVESARVETLPAPAATATAATEPASALASAQQSAGETYSYTCASGKQIIASYFADEDRVDVIHEGKTVPMKIAVSASGARYIGEGWVWWTKGTTEASLFRATESGDTGELLESCTGSGEPIDNPHQES
jgi:membrane-bound inhibitor of C-type lysozyme